MPGFTTATYSYGDGRGNLTADGTSSYTYDSENKLTQVQTGATTRGLSYDSVGRLAAYDNGLATKWFVYDGAEAVAEVDTSGNITRRYIRGDGADEIILEYVGSGTGDPRYHHRDERGSTIAWSGQQDSRKQDPQGEIDESRLKMSLYNAASSEGAGSGSSVWRHLLSSHLRVLRGRGRGPGATRKHRGSALMT